MQVEQSVSQVPPANRWISSKALALAAAVTVAGLAAPASAQMVWTGAASNAWENPSNWDPNFGSPPTSFDVAILNNGDTIVLSQPGQEVDIFDVGYGDDVVGAPGSGTLHMTGGDITATAGLRFGTSEGGSGNLLLDAGDITVGIVGTPSFNLVLFGDWGDSLGNVVNGGSIIANGIGVAFQPTSTADLTINGGVVSGRDRIDIARFRNPETGQFGTGTVNVNGGTLNTTGVWQDGNPAWGDIVVGFSGTGILNLTAGNVDAAANLVLAVHGPDQNAPSAAGIINQSGGAVSGGIVLIGEGGNGTYNMSGGTLNARASVEVGRFSAGSSFTMSGDAAATVGNREFFGHQMSMVIGDSGTGTFNIGDDASLDASGAIIVSSFAVANGTLNQSGNSSLSATNLLVAREGVGVVNQTGGTANYSGYLRLGDFDNSNGTYAISGGDLTVGGNLSVGAALASNAPADPGEPTGPGFPGSQGQASNANGVFHVIGSASTISVGGDLVANPGDKSDLAGAPNSATFIFDFDAGGITPITIGGIADLDGAVIDINGGEYLTFGDQYTLIDAAGGFGNAGAGWVLTQGTGEGFSLGAEDQGLFLLDVMSNGSGGEMLVASLVPEPTTAMVGLLGGMGLLMRRRRA